ERLGIELGGERLDLGRVHHRLAGSECHARLQILEPQGIGHRSFPWWGGHSCLPGLVEAEDQSGGADMRVCQARAERQTGMPAPPETRFAFQGFSTKMSPANLSRSLRWIGAINDSARDPTDTTPAPSLDA